MKRFITASVVAATLVVGGSAVASASAESNATLCPSSVERGGCDPAPVFSLECPRGYVTFETIRRPEGRGELAYCESGRRPKAEDAKHLRGKVERLRDDKARLKAKIERLQNEVSKAQGKTAQVQRFR